ncbi:hypothetical protein EWI61_00115 [Methylolobus aquaticus]|nr:hypothetical protein EWI61_00115 [Methylolobus aquaticus]
MNLKELKSFGLKWKSSVTELQQKREELIAEREQLEARLLSLRQAYVPVADLKGFFMDYIDAEGERILPEIRKRLHSFIHPPRFPGIVPTDKITPLTFDEMEAVLMQGGAGPHGSGARTRDGQSLQCRPLCGFREPEGMDQIFFLFMGDLIKTVLAKHWDAFGLGYQNVRASEIGSDRATRRKEVADVEAQIERVNAEIVGLDASLQELKAGVL